MQALTQSVFTELSDSSIYLSAFHALTHQHKGFGPADQWCNDNSCPSDVMALVDLAKTADRVREMAYETLTLTAMLALLRIETKDEPNHKKTFLRNGVLVGRFDSGTGWEMLRELGSPMTPTEFDTAFRKHVESMKDNDDNLACALSAT